jgi:Transglutaminase-like superfamily
VVDSVPVRKLHTMRALSWPDRGLVAEAALLLAAARAVVRLLPYRWFQRWLTLDRAGSAPNPLLVTRVRRAVNIASRNVPFAAVCLPQAMAAKAMLGRRGASSSLFVGAARDAAGEMILHAWLESGGTIVTGDAGRSAVTPIARFS